MKKIVLGILIFCIVSFGKSVSGFKHYCNSWADPGYFCVNYPNNFLADPPSASGDGRMVYSRDHTFKMNVYSSWNGLADGYNINQELQSTKSYFNVITYKAHKGDWYVFSGYDNNGNIMYVKQFFGPNKHGTGVVHTIWFTYSSAESYKYDKLIKVILRSYEYRY